MSRRFQITLTESQYEFLRRASESTSLSVAELVRRAIDEKYPAGKTLSRREFTVAVWRRPPAPATGRRSGVRLD
jgi:hypothetical protein